MTTWLSDASANRHIKTYVKDFLDVSGNMYVRNTDDYAWNTYGQVLSGPYETGNGSNFGYHVSMDASGTTIASAAYYGDEDTTDTGSYYVYRYDETATLWYKLGNTIPGTGTSGVGTSVAVSGNGNIVAVANAYDNQFLRGSGIIKVYEYNAGTNAWDQLGSYISGLQDSRVGENEVSLNFDGTRVCIGTVIKNPSGASVYSGFISVYQYNSGSNSWSQLGSEMTGDNTNFIVFGGANAISSDGTTVVGLSRATYSSGTNYTGAKLFVYTLDSNTSDWILKGSSVVSTQLSENDSELFTSINSDGTIVAIAAPYSHVHGLSDNGGAEVYQYDASSDTWNQLGSTLIGANASDGFGYSVSLSSDGYTLAVTAQLEDTGGSNQGSLYIYKYKNGDWELIQQLAGQYSNGTNTNSCHINADGTKVVVGGHNADVNSTESGVMRAFQWSQKTYTNPALDISGGTITMWGGAEHVVANYSVSQLGSTLIGNSEGLGVAVNMNYTGDRMIVNVANASDTQGEVYVYQYRNGDWFQIGSTIVGPHSGSYLGVPCVINSDGNVIAAADHRASDGGNEGSILVYEFINGDWSQKGSTIDGSTSGNVEYFGVRGTCISGDGSVVAGLSGEGGYARVFKYVADTTNDWVQMGSNFTTNSNGLSVAATSRLLGLSDDGTIFALSSPLDDTTGTNNGKVEVYKFTGDVSTGSWSQIGSTIYGIVHSSGESKEGATISLSADGTILATSSWYYDSNKSIIRVFKYIDSIEDWTQIGTNILHDEQDSLARGFEMSADGKTLAAGAPTADEGPAGNDDGATIIYKYIDGNWVFIKQINNTYGVADMYLGKYVTISGDGTRFAAGSNTNPGLVEAWEITNNPAMKIEDGNVGIGTDSPEQKLQVKGADNTYPAIRLSNDTNNFDIMMTGSSFNDALFTNRGNGNILFETTGNVGIGTTSSVAAQLTLSRGNNTAAQLELRVTGGIGDGEFTGITFTQEPDGSTELSNIRCNYSDDGSPSLSFGVRSVDTAMLISKDGYVGIGTTSPLYPLHINKAVGASLNARYFRYIHDLTFPNSNASFQVSLFASGGLFCNGIIGATSDRRIKKDIVEINDDTALQQIRLLKPSKYRYRDYIHRGTEEVIGFIAQEVRESIPQAVKIQTDDIPNIYIMGSGLTDASGNHIITIPDYDTSTLEVDASGNIFPKLKIVIDEDDKDKELFVNIQEVISTTELKVELIGDDISELPSEIFIYGQEVDNKHVLVKDRIFAVGISALQEVDRQLQAEKAKTALLETQLADVLARLSALESA